MENNHWFFDTELLIHGQWQGLRTKEIPVRWVDDPDSRVKLLPTICEDLAGIWRLRRLRKRMLGQVGRTEKPLTPGGEF